jgi:hypothetical protein
MKRAKAFSNFAQVMIVCSKAKNIEPEKKYHRSNDRKKKLVTA